MQIPQTEHLLQSFQLFFNLSLSEYCSNENDKVRQHTHLSLSHQQNKENRMEEANFNTLVHVDADLFVAHYKGNERTRNSNRHMCLDFVTTALLR